MTAPSLLDATMAALAAIAPVRRDEPISRHTTFGIGGPADLYTKATSAEQLRRIFVLARSRGLPVFVLGSGSNILVSDRGIRGLVIENDAKAVRGPFPQPSGAARFTVESGASFAGLARRLCREGFAGLEWATGIPGTLGGAVVYNAGAYGGQLADVLVTASIVDAHGTQAELTAVDLGLAYRSSAFTRGLLHDRLVLTTTIDLSPADAGGILATVAAHDAKRLAAQPRGRNAGSIFKNPPGHVAWQLIDAAGLRGARHGGAEISAKHTNFFSNTGQATAADVKALIDLAQARVREQFGIELQREVQLVGDFD